MATKLRYFYAAMAFVITLSLSIIAYKLSQGSVPDQKATSHASIDYTNFVVILLTTVTVIFSVCALVLGILGIVGFRNLKKEAGKFASQQALSEISAAFEEDGPAQKQIRAEFTNDDGHLKKWAEKRIRQEVIELIPLIIGRFADGKINPAMDEDADTDEGDVN